MKNEDFVSRGLIFIFIFCYWLTKSSFFTYLIFLFSFIISFLVFMWQLLKSEIKWHNSPTYLSAGFLVWVNDFFFLLLASCSLVSVDGSSNFVFCANYRYWLMTCFMAFKYLVLILLIFAFFEFYSSFNFAFSLILIVVFFSHWLSTFACGFFLVFCAILFRYIFFLFALKLRGDCPFKIFALSVFFFFQYFRLALKAPFSIVFSMDYGRPMWFKKLPYS